MAMNGTDRPIDESLEPSEDPSAADTGFWPSPVIDDQAPDLPPGDEPAQLDAIAMEQRVKSLEFSPWSVPDLPPAPDGEPTVVAEESAKILEAIAGVEVRIDQRL